MKENNKLIAEFMGFKWHEEPFNSWFHKGMDVRLLKFHNSWDWLMPVLEKIEELGYDTIISKGYCIANYGDQICSIGKDFCNGHFKVPDPSETKIEATYQEVIRFIKQYDENGK